MKRLVFLIAITLFCSRFGFAQSTNSAPSSAATAKSNEKLSSNELPGDGLRQHDFLYAGEDKERRVFIIRKGQVDWLFEAPQSWLNSNLNPLASDVTRSPFQP